MESRDNPVVRISFQFALDIVVFTEILQERKKFRLVDQLFSSGTSIGANVREAQGCESRADFIHKLQTAYKEAEETKYWLEICEQSEGYPKPEKLLDDIIVILKLLGKIIASSRRRK